MVLDENDYAEPESPPAGLIWAGPKDFDDMTRDELVERLEDSRRGNVLHDLEVIEGIARSRDPRQVHGLLKAVIRLADKFDLQVTILG
jgi:hypothetical protein